MGWNGSGDIGRARPPGAPKKKSPSALRGLLAGAAVVAILAAAVFYVAQNRDRHVAADKVKNPNVEKALSGREELKRLLAKKAAERKSQRAVERRETNDVRSADLEVSKTKRSVLAARSHKPLFHSMAECQLDGIVNTPLGSNYYDDEVPEEFEEEFAFSLTNRIVITEDDSPEDAARKQRVIEAKETLVELKKQGADLRKVLLEQKKILLKKFEDYTFFEQGLTELRKAEASPEEIAEYAVAAKKMMEEKELGESLVLDFDESAAVEEIESLINGAKKGDTESKDVSEEGDE